MKRRRIMINVAASTHVSRLIVMVGVYKKGEAVELGIAAKHRPCKGKNHVKSTSQIAALTSIPWRSLRKVSTNKARPTKWSWFPKTGPEWKAKSLRYDEHMTETYKWLRQMQPSATTSHWLVYWFDCQSFVLEWGSDWWQRFYFGKMMYYLDEVSPSCTRWRCRHHGDSSSPTRGSCTARASPSLSDKQAAQWKQNYIGSSIQPSIGPIRFKM